MKKLAILSIYFISSSLCAQNVFKCKDPKGQTIYSDMPCASQTKNVPISDSSFGGNKDIDEEVITAIAKQKPYYFVMRDSSMANDSVATNFEQIFATYSPDTVRKVL